MRKLAGLVLSILLLAGITPLIAATLTGPEIIPPEASCVEVEDLDAQVWVCTLPDGTTTTTTLPPTTTTTQPSTTTTTEPPITTTTTIPFEPDQCVVDQIAREPFKQSGNEIKSAFDIIINNLDEPVQADRNLWTAPYIVDLNTKIDNFPANWGWISGDRAGYSKAYMFLVNRDTAEVVARVSFRNIPESAGYLQVNDKFMDEIMETGIGWDGTCADGSPDDPNSQAQAPAVNTEYVIDDPTEVRPLIPMFVDGVQVEDRSYTNTETPPTSKFRFVDLGLVTEPYIEVNGVGGEPHIVYSSQRVGGIVNVGGEWSLAVVVYYDWLVPNGSFVQ